MSRFRTYIVCAIATVFLCGTAAQVLADPVGDGVKYDFVGLSNNNATDTAIGEAQLSMTVKGVDGFPQLVDFLFENSGPDACSIARIYWDDDWDQVAPHDRVLQSLLSITNGPGVNFATSFPGAQVLPGGEELTPAFAVDVKAGSTAPDVQANGVNPGEWVKIRFQLVAGKTFADVTSALNPLNPTLRVGIHVIGFASGGSESFIAVPLPGVAMAGLALFGGLAAVRVRRPAPEDAGSAEA